jgi:hypothetical protein
MDYLSPPPHCKASRLRNCHPKQWWSLWLLLQVNNCLCWGEYQFIAHEEGSVLHMLQSDVRYDYSHGCQAGSIRHRLSWLFAAVTNVLTWNNNINFQFIMWLHKTNILMRHLLLRGAPNEVNWIFSIYLSLPPTLGLGVYSVCNRNEYQKQKNNVSGE